MKQKKKFRNKFTIRTKKNLGLTRSLSVSIVNSFLLQKNNLPPVSLLYNFSFGSSLLQLNHIYKMHIFICQSQFGVKQIFRRKAEVVIDFINAKKRFFFSPKNQRSAKIRKSNVKNWAFFKYLYIKSHVNQIEDGICQVGG